MIKSGVITHGHWQHQEFEPAEALRDTIKCFWHNKRSFENTASEFQVMPDSSTEIIFYFGSPCYLVVNESRHLLSSPFMIGLLEQPAVFAAANHLEIIGIRCYPWTVYNLLGLPVANGGVQMLQHPVAQLLPVLKEYIACGNVEKALDHVQQYFLRACARITTDNPLSKAGAAMSEANGTLPVSSIAAAAHSTVRTLERKFRQSSGHTVKDISGLMRFEQVRNRLLLQPDTGLAGLALEAGYTDQAHLSRAFKRYSGITPAAFARNAKQAKS